MSVRADAAALVLIVLVGCGSTQASGPRADAATDSGGGDHPGTTGDAPGDADAPGDVAAGSDALACGDAICRDDQICAIDLCGGGPIQCTPAGDGGQCADGGVFRDNGCPGTGPSGGNGPGCFPGPCQNPPPRCTDRPAACGSTLRCDCAAAACAPRSCAFVSGGMITCAYQ